jgi:hypothetical protein
MFKAPIQFCSLYYIRYQVIAEIHLNMSHYLEKRNFHPVILQETAGRSFSKTERISFDCNVGEARFS